MNLHSEHFEENHSVLSLKDAEARLILEADEPILSERAARKLG